MHSEKRPSELIKEAEEEYEFKIPRVARLYITSMWDKEVERRKKMEYAIQKIINGDADDSYNSVTHHIKKRPRS